MLKFVQNFFSPKANPIGVDFGSDCLRMAQVQVDGNEHRLVAAASADVPSHVRHDPAGRLQFFVESSRDLLAQGNFRGRQAVLCMPAALMHVIHLRMNKLDDAETKSQLQWEVRGKLPIDPSVALLRHIVAGEVYQDNEPKQEVIVLGALRDTVNQLLSAAGRAKLDVVGMNVEPKAIIDCFAQVYRRKTDAESVTLYIDVGSSGTRAVIARAGQIYFARTIPIGGDHFNRAAAAALKINLEDAKLARMKTVAQSPLDERPERLGDGSSELVTAEIASDVTARRAEDSFALLNVAVARAALGSPEKESISEDKLIEQAVREPLSRLVEELDLCRRYHESTFPTAPVDRLVFVGGEAKQRSLCQYIARELGVAAQVGDPLVRMGRTSDIGIESGIDRRQPQPDWAVAIGLSLGPVNVMAAGPATSAK